MNEELIKLQKKQMRYMRIQTIILSIILAIVVFAGGILGYTTIAMRQQNVDLDKISKTLSALENVSTELDEMDLEVIHHAISSMADAADTFAEADMEAINKGIVSMADAAQKLKDMDIEKLNDLIVSLQKTASQMEKTTSVFSKIFG